MAADPLNPREGQPPTDPFEDPLLDEIERSVERPPDLGDPLLGDDVGHIDDLGRLLGGLEGMVTIPPAAGMAPTTPQRPGEISEDEVKKTEPMTAPETAPRDEDWPTRGYEQHPPLPPDRSPEEGGHGLSPALLPRRGGGGSGRRRNRAIDRRRGRKPVNRPGGSMQRWCHEARDLVDWEICESCDKFRHWPDGTDEEPRECWHDWQARQAAEESDEENE